VRILLVNWNDRENPHAGGAEIHLHEIFGRLTRQGHAIDLVTSGWPGAAPHAELDGMTLRRVGGRHTFALRARPTVRRLLAANRYDVVVEDINKLPLFLAGLTETPFSALVPHLFGTTAFREASWPVAAVVWAAERHIPRAYRRAWFHAISESTRDDLARRGVPRERIEVIHPGVDAAWYTPDAAVSRTREPTFLYVGRLKRYKGVEIALRALAVARKSRPDVVLDIAGQGDDRGRLERLARRLGLGTAARFRGFVSDEEKRRLLRRSWCVVLASPKEGWGISNVEAAACGTPAIASDSPGLRESVQHGETGFLVPHGDVVALADRMLALAGDPALVSRLGMGARAFAERLSWDHAAQTTEAHLQRVIARGRGGAG
jgi:glycosyltransferase involved in cell wall biosynthesis